MIFQDPYASLNPMQMVGNIVAEPLLNYKKMSKEEVKAEVMHLLNCVGLSEEAYYKYAHEFSGGQRQRIGIARAIALRPKLIVADEPVSALDVSVQSQVLNILKDLQDEFKLSYLFIAHDLSVVKHISDVIGVMYLGHMVEIASHKIFTISLYILILKHLFLQFHNLIKKKRTELFYRVSYLHLVILLVVVHFKQDVH